MAKSQHVHQPSGDDPRPLRPEAGPDPASDAEIFLKFSPSLRRFCRRRVPRSDVDDAVQDTFIRFLRRKNRDVENVEAWLIHAANWSCINIRKRLFREQQHRKHLHSGDRDGKDWLNNVPDAHARDPERWIADQEWLRILLHRLGERDRTIVTHLYLMDAPVADVAIYLGISVEHARVSALRARQKARVILAAIGQDGFPPML